MRARLPWAFGAALAAGIAVFPAGAVTDRCTKMPYGTGSGLNLQDFYYAYAALGRTVATAKQAAEADDITRLLVEATDLCHEAAAFDKFNGRVPDRMRNDYRRVTSDLDDLGEALAIATRQHDAVMVSSTVTRMQDSFKALPLHVPPRWLSAASTLHGARQPGRPHVLDW